MVSFWWFGWDTWWLCLLRFVWCGGFGFVIDCGVLRYVSVFVVVLGWF